MKLTIKMNANKNIRSCLILLLTLLPVVSTSEEGSATSATTIGTSPTLETNRKFDDTAGRDAAVNQSVHTKLKDSKPPSELANELEVPSGGVQPWYQDASKLTAMASVGAVFISVIALFISHRSSVKQQTREKREELRGVLERLVILREDLTSRVNKITDEQERMEASIHMNTKRTVYLEAAESLAAQIRRDVTYGEYYIIGTENQLESDFSQARKYYRMAVKASLRSSLVNQAIAWRTLAGSYFLQEPFRDLVEGRKCYGKAVGVLKGQADPYSVHTTVLTYRLWSSSEFWSGDTDRAAMLLTNAYDQLSNLPLWYEPRGFEMRTIANSWKTLGMSYFQRSNVEQGREAFIKALKTVEVLTDNYTDDIRGQVYQEWASQEINCGVKQECESLLNKARQCYMSLAIDYPGRDTKLKAVEDMFLLLGSQSVKS